MSRRGNHHSKAVLLVGVLTSSIVFTSALAHAETQAAGPLPSPSPKTSTTPRAHSPRKSALMKRTWGIEVKGAHLVAGGYMIEFRYRVIDAEKAKLLSNRKVKPYLVDQETGAKVIVPSPQKVGELRNVNAPMAGKDYWIMFANPGRLVKPGSKVNVVIGDFQANNLVVN